MNQDKTFFAGHSGLLGVLRTIPESATHLLVTLGCFIFIMLNVICIQKTFGHVKDIKGTQFDFNVTILNSVKNFH